jgi:hypothetical protein
MSTPFTTTFTPRTRREVIIRELNRGQWWVIYAGVGSDGQTTEEVCAERREPFTDLEEARRAAKWVASHFLNDDGSPLEIKEQFV